MNTFAYEYPTKYEIIITDGTAANSFDFEFGKDQDLEVSIRESRLIVDHAMNRKNAVPVSV